MLGAFKIKPYDLEPVFATWTEGPIFDGNPKTDMPVEDWLDLIKAECEARKIPEEYWYKVAQHFMGPAAKARLNELKAVIAKVHGGRYRWTWKKFRVAMQSMGWNIDGAQTQTIKVSKSTGSWWTLKRKESQDGSSVAAATEGVPPRPTPSRSNSIFRSSKKASEEKVPRPPVPVRSESSFWGTKKVVYEEPAEAPAVHRPPTRSNTEMFWPKRASKEEADDEEKRPSLPPKSSSDVGTTVTRPKPPTPTRSHTIDAGAVTTITQAPIWLLNACNALEYITSEHPKAMSVISAILITAGSIPAIPAISAGAGGAVLASGAAHAIGAIAVGLGQALNSTMKNQNQNQTPSDSHAVIHESSDI